MAEINLLPDELREKESKELKTTKKKSKSFGISMSNPKKQEKIDQPLKKSKPSLLSRLFATKIDQPKMSEPPKTAEILKPDSDAYGSSKSKDSILHIPKIEEKIKEEKSNVEITKKQDQEKDFTKQPTDELKEKVEIVEKDKEKIEQPVLKKTKPKKSKKRFAFFKSKKGRDKKSEVENKKEEDKKDRPDEEKEEDSFLDVDLIPQDLNKKPDLEVKGKMIKGGIVVFLALMIVALGYLGITWYKLRTLQQKKSMEEEISLLDIQIGDYNDQKKSAFKMQSRLKTIKNLLDNHIYWTEFFDLLEKYTVKDVYYLNFAMAGRDKLIISAMAKDYETVAKQLVAFQQANDFVSNVKIDAVVAEIDLEEGQYSGVNFNINLEFQPGVFFKPIE